jgi:hypothetical protein
VYGWLFKLETCRTICNSYDIPIMVHYVVYINGYLNLMLVGYSTTHMAFQLQSILACMNDYLNLKFLIRFVSHLGFMF